METTIVYIDDLLSFAPTLAEHLENLDRLLERLQEAGFTLNLAKCQFLQEKITFVGHEITAAGVTPKPATIEQIMDFPTPKNVKKVRGFLGVTSWLRRFIPKLAEKSEPLYQLTSKNQKFVWLPIHQQAFEDIKLAASKIKMLEHPRPHLLLRLQSDASFKGLAACLFQIDEKDEKLVLQHASRVLKGPELNYSATELEAVAILFGILKWRVYLEGREFVIHTDNHALTFLKMCRPPNSRLMRFVLFLQQFNFRVEHMRGTENFLADYLSRNPDQQGSQNQQNPGKCATIQVFRVNTTHELLKKMRKINQYQDEQVEWRVLKETLGQKDTDPSGPYLIHQDVLFKNINGKFKIILPDILLDLVLDFFHTESGHFGIVKTMAKIQEVFYHPQLRKWTKKFVKRCDICQRSKYNNQPMCLDFRPIIVSEPGEIVSSDLFGPLPKGRGQATYVLVLYDLFSKLIKFYALRKATATSVLNRYEKYCKTVGPPQSILSDQGTQYTAKIYTARMKEWGIKIRYSSVRHPVANPVERVMKELGRLCRAYCHHSHPSWANFLQRFEDWLNSSVSTVTGFTPNLVHFGTAHNPINQIIKFPQNTVSEETMEDLQKLVRQRLEVEGNKRRHKNKLPESEGDFEKGDWVLLRAERQSSAWDKEIKKFHLLFDGPFEVKKKIHLDTFLLSDPVTRKERGIFNRVWLKKYQI
jgi:hypothetical protein